MKNLILMVKREMGTLRWDRDSLRDYLIILAGAFLQGISMRLFIIPTQLLSGGLTGAALIINYLTEIPIGLMIFIGNVPLFFLGWRYLGGLRFVLRSVVAISLFSFFTDISALFLPAAGVSDDLVINSLYGAILGGLGLGMVYRGKGTTGGTDILGRIMNHKLGISISNAYLITDTVVILLGGLIFNWELALYGLAVIYVMGLAAQTAFEGPAVYRTAIIISNQPSTVSEGIMRRLNRGVTMLYGEGGFTQQKRDVLYVVVTQSEIPLLKEIVKDADVEAFMVIGQAHEALGEGFRSLSPEM